MKRKGFTLIEMLIVIAVIGVLAVAVLSAINPIEQMRKARDTRRRSNAAELMNALERYYTTYEAYPADYLAEAADGTDCGAATSAPNQITSAGCATLISVAELKSEFTARIDTVGNELYGAIDTLGGTDLAVVCYEVESQANIGRYFPGGSPLPNACTGAGGEYYVCVPE